ncbi:2-amino-4-hydroxy-6-hydroxymethyldihydropteridine diphosphokinase [Colwellia sp. Arc7-D]|uniref:2-amino-4-hydroxy-6- hydroxymethyldihydropteridine diphosphokinase n=1 Tax=Colwellia sp. Arc7-D TaxID=2161872 RepID=UPI000D356221|nr:2-amino-4-hydroxy-6-hydroxymethyldihydropteridine diphosphokinase [Colwellia sp. Arc7-D]AWB56610.1 2-amino-4-hydroxy-6-hydroxymethyldihydropteridine diphosphokinase [Colwellia sp. Arc7-D]
MPLAYIGLGSNLSDPQAQISAALEKLHQLKCCIVTQVSSLYFSRPMGPQDQPDYMNAVVAIETSFSAIELLEQLQEIENMTGRIRKDNRWGARILDLDIILFDQQVINTARLTIPHYGLKQREFVLLPLAEIAPNLFLPDGDSINELASKIAKNGLKIHSKLS